MLICHILFGMPLVLVAVGVVCSITFSVQRLVWAPREAHVSTESRLDKGVYPLAPILITPLSWITLTRIISPFSSLSVIPGWRHSNHLGQDPMGYDQSFLSRWQRHSLRTMGYTGRLPALLESLFYCYLCWDNFSMECVIPIISNSF